MVNKSVLSFARAQCEINDLLIRALLETATAKNVLLFGLFRWRCHYPRISNVTYVIPLIWT
jgi:hypothetical protein